MRTPHRASSRPLPWRSPAGPSTSSRGGSGASTYRGYGARASLLALAAWCVSAMLAVSAHAAWDPPGVDLGRPRILFRAGEEPLLQARLEREPYVGIVADMMRRAAHADSVALDDHSVNGERIKSRAAKNLAFLYALDRTFVGGSVVPFASQAARAAAGARVHELLLHMFNRSRLAVPPPIGGWDRDISTSEELLQYASAYDAMLGAGYDFGADREVIERSIVDLASELYENFVDPDSANGVTRLHQNNHRSKSGAAMVLAAIAVAEFTPAPGSDPRNVREPTLWLEYGLDQVDLIMRHVLVTGDGAYAEGPFYLRFASQNLIPFGRAWERLVGGAVWMARGIEVPSLWHHPLWLRTQRWMLDMTLPDGSMAPIDDGNPGRSHYFGALPPDLPWASAFAWRWANAPQKLETDGNVDLGADAIVLYDDGLPAGPPEGPSTAFYHEGGNAIFRSDWSAEGIVAVALAEHDTASEFGRDREGRGIYPQSHEHAEPGAYLLHAFGERLALDPGYLSFTEHGIVNQPQHHNTILVDGKGPRDYLSASFGWASDPFGPPPADGQAYLSATLDGPFLDAATVDTTYGLAPARIANISRRFLFPDHRYLVIADEVSSPGAPARAWTWLVQGNGGGSSGGSFAATPAGGRWTRPAARLDAAIALDAAAASFATSVGQHEAPGKILTTHTVLRMSATAERLRSVQVLYPGRTADGPPAVAELEVPGTAALALADPDGDRRVLALHRAATTPLEVAAATSGLQDAATDGTVALFDAHPSGALRLAWAENATFVRYAGVEHLRAATRGRIGIALEPGRVELVVDNGEPEVAVHGLPFTPLAADGACALVQDGSGAVLALSRERRVTLRASGGNSAPAADAGADRFVAVGDRVQLDAAASCDLDGDVLAAAWELVAAPKGSAWSFDDADTALPSLLADVPGVFRLRLTVTDAHGAASLPADLVVRAVAPGEDADGDLVPDDVDNCPLVANAAQEDRYPAAGELQGNGVGDACECSDGACARGGGPAATDCNLELRTLGPAIVDGRRIRCRDGAPCDRDPAPGWCGFDVVLCLRNEDRLLSVCSPFTPHEVRVQHWLPGGRSAIVEPLLALPGATRVDERRVAFDPPLAARNVCTEPFRLVVPVPGRALNLVVRGTGRRESDSDRVRFVCER